MNSLYENLLSFLGDNQFASGGLLIGLGGIAYHHGLGISKTLYRFLKGRMFITVEVNRRDYGFRWIRSWLGSILEQQGRTIHEYEIDAKSDIEGHSAELTQSHGTWLIPVNNFRLFVRMERREESTDYGTTIYNKISLTTTRWNKRKLKELMSEIALKHSKTAKNRIFVPTSDGHDWDEWCAIPQTSINDVLLSNGVKEMIMNDLDRFESSFEKYRELCIPYKRGYLLYGPPGNGKTTLIRAIANHTGKSIALVKASLLTISSVQNLIAKTNGDKIIVIEDIDRVGVVNKTDEKKGQADSITKEKCSLDSILNTLDGVQGGNGQIVIATTNHPEKLDPAFLRPGRIDVRVNVENASKEQIISMFERFFGTDTAAAVEFEERLVKKKHSMAKIQGYLMKYLDDPEGALANIGELDDE